MASQIMKTKIARPAARKSSGGRTKPSKSGTSRSRKPDAAAEVAAEPVAAPNPRKRFVELPKVVGELPTPTATFYF